MEDNLKKKMEDDLQKLNGRQTNQPKSTLLAVNSPSLYFVWLKGEVCIINDYIKCLAGLS